MFLNPQMFLIFPRLHKILLKASSSPFYVATFVGLEFVFTHVHRQLMHQTVLLQNAVGFSASHVIDCK